MLAEDGRAGVREGKPVQSIALFSELIGLNRCPPWVWLNKRPTSGVTIPRTPQPI